MEITKEDKIAIVARAMFADNLDTYESYEEAVREVKVAAPHFVDRMADLNIIRKSGSILFLSPRGHMANVREADDNVDFENAMTKDDLIELQEASQKAYLALGPEKPKASDVFTLMGWKKI